MRAKPHPSSAVDRPRFIFVVRPDERILYPSVTGLVLGPGSTKKAEILHERGVAVNRIYIRSASAVTQAPRGRKDKVGY